MNEETKKAIDESIAHWKRMIAWAEKQDPIEFKRPSKMQEEIKEVWDVGNCSLCDLYFTQRCENCPLKLKGYKCERKHIPISPWAKVHLSMNWGEWVYNAKEFLKILEGLKDERF